MSLNDLSLNPHLLTQLYTNSLLETEQKPINTAGRKAPTEVAVDVLQEATEKIPAPDVVAPKTEIQADAVAENNQPQSAVVANEQPVTYSHTPSLGGNKKGVLILVKNASAPFLPDSELEFLSAILSACHLSIADVAIVNLHHHALSYTELLKQFAAKQVLLMGVTPTELDLPFDFPHFQLQAFDSRTYLSANPLGYIAQDRQLKMQLWGCLKQLFGV